MSIRRFASLGALTLFMRNTSIPALALAEHEILEMTGRRISERAKQKIGVPQPGWPPLQESTIARKQRAGAAQPEAPLLLTGALKDSITYVVHESESMVEVGTNDPKAKYQELGAAGVPPRPFLAPAAFEVLDQLQDEIPVLIGAAIMGEVK
jgi:phage gpG-like protein